MGRWNGVYTVLCCVSAFSALALEDNLIFSRDLPCAWDRWGLWVMALQHSNDGTTRLIELRSSITLFFDTGFRDWAVCAFVDAMIDGRDL